MADSNIISCGDIRKQAKPFLEDLLAEDEYQLFIQHLADCPKCNDYVGKFGALSNQLWKMGDVKVPSDFFGSTVLFNLSQLEKEASTPKPGGAKNFIALAVTLIVVGAIAYAGGNFIMKKGGSGKASDAPVVTTQMMVDRQDSDNPQAAALLGELQSIAASLGVPGEKSGDKEKTEEAPVAARKPSSPSDNSLNQKIVNAQNDRSLHWHFLYGENSEKIKLMEIISFLGIDTRKQVPSLVVLSANGEKLDELMEKIASGFQGETTLSKISVEQSAPRGKDSRVSTDFENQRPKPSQDLHWHLKRFQMSKTRFIDIIRKGGGSVDYELEDFLIVLFPKNQVEKLSKKLAIMGIYLETYGRLAAKDDRLDSGPITISVYFS